MATYRIVLTFDADTTSHEPDYDAADKKLADLGLMRSIMADDGNDHPLPFNTYVGVKDFEPVGVFKGDGGSPLADEIWRMAVEALRSCDIVGKVFVYVSVQGSLRVS